MLTCLQRFGWREKVYFLQVVSLQVAGNQSQLTLILLTLHCIEKKLLLSDLQHFEGDESVFFLQTVSFELQLSVNENLHGSFFNFFIFIFYFLFLFF
jgi:hypothetical protein